MPYCKPLCFVSFQGSGNCCGTVEGFNLKAKLTMRKAYSCKSRDFLVFTGFIFENLVCPAMQ